VKLGFAPAIVSELWIHSIPSGPYPMVQIVPAALHSAAKCLPSDDKGKLFYSVQLRVPLPFWSPDVFFPSELTQYMYVNQFQSVIGAVSQ
jgi:hypothetical protein